LRKIEMRQLQLSDCWVLKKLARETMAEDERQMSRVEIATKKGKTVKKGRKERIWKRTRK
jgi:hypothetical protein